MHVHTVATNQRFLVDRRRAPTFIHPLYIPLQATKTIPSFPSRKFKNEIQPFRRHPRCRNERPRLRTISHETLNVYKCNINVFGSRNNGYALWRNLIYFLGAWNVLDRNITTYVVSSEIKQIIVIFSCRLRVDENVRGGYWIINVLLHEYFSLHTHLYSDLMRTYTGNNFKRVSNT